MWGYDVWGLHDDMTTGGQLNSYAKSTDNIRLDGNGHLIIQARKSGNHTYTSGRLVTRGKVNMT
jgi:hypothetical protein